MTESNAGQAGMRTYVDQAESYDRIKSLVGQSSPTDHWRISNNASGLVDNIQVLVT